MFLIGPCFFMHSVYLCISALAWTKLVDYYLVLDFLFRIVFNLPIDQSKSYFGRYLNCHWLFTGPYFFSPFNFSVNGFLFWFTVIFCDIFLQFSALDIYWQKQVILYLLPSLELNSTSKCNYIIR